MTRMASAPSDVGSLNSRGLAGLLLDARPDLGRGRLAWLFGVRLVCEQLIRWIGPKAPRSAYVPIACAAPNPDEEAKRGEAGGRPVSAVRASAGRPRTSC